MEIFNAKKMNDLASRSMPSFSKKLIEEEIRSKAGNNEFSTIFSLETEEEGRDISEWLNSLLFKTEIKLSNNELKIFIYW